MTRFSSRRFVKMLRITALAMLMLAVLVNPVLAAVGDMHESGHDAAGILQLADDHHVHFFGNGLRRRHLVTKQQLPRQATPAGNGRGFSAQVARNGRNCAGRETDRKSCAADPEETQ